MSGIDVSVERLYGEHVNPAFVRLLGVYGYGRVMTRGQILDHVWDDNFEPVANAVDVLLGRVRRKVDREGRPPLIHTVRGVGYVISDRPTAVDGA